MPISESTSASSYKLRSIILESDMLVSGASINITNLMSDFEIFEHIEKPYLTANFVFTDSSGLFDSVTWAGGEKITISFSSPDTDIEITKSFAMAEIKKGIKNDNRAEVYYLSLIEYDAYRSETYNVNSCYTGKATEIIDNILTETIYKKDGRNIHSIGEPAQNNMKVIIPNMSPLEACSWIKDRATNEDGLPYFLFSTLVGDLLKFINLGDLLNDVSLSKYPFIHNEVSNSASMDLILDARSISSFKYERTENLFKLISGGSVGAKHSYHNLVNNKSQELNLNVVDDIFEPLVNKEVLTREQSQYNFIPFHQVDDEFLHEKESALIPYIRSHNVFSDGFNASHNSLDEDNGIGEYKRKVVSQVVKNYLVKSPITITVPCRLFIGGKDSVTIGRLIDLKFLSSDQTQGSETAIDTKKSGQYLIYSARHMLKSENYHIVMTCVKLSNLKSEVA